jgi:importin-5
MSVLPPQVHQALGQLLVALTSGDNAVRGQAETALNDDWVNPQSDVLLMGLVEQIEGAEDPQVRGAESPTDPLSVFNRLSVKGANQEKSAPIICSGSVPAHFD